MTSDPVNKGYIVWPEPGPRKPDGSWPNNTVDDLPYQENGWYDDGQGGMVIYAVVLESKAGTMVNQWDLCPRATLSHLLFGKKDEIQEGYFLAVVPLAVSSWCWGLYKNGEFHHFFEATSGDLTGEGRIFVRQLETLYGLPVEIVTHIDT